MAICSDPRPLMALLVAASLSSCGSRAVPCTDPRAADRFHACTVAVGRAECEGAGGSWTTPQPLIKPDLQYCKCPTGQGGCPCSRDSDCLDRCAGPHPDPAATTSGDACRGATFHCTDHSPTLGCACTPDGTLCVD